MGIRINYRKLAFANYPPICAYCGFGIPEVLEVAHLDGDRNNNDLENLVILCPNCHKLHDLGLIPTRVIVEMRDIEKVVDWSKRMKDAGRKAAATRKRRTDAMRRKRRIEARKAVQTRRENRRLLTVELTPQ
jgi:hypothetical protein